MLTLTLTPIPTERKIRRGPNNFMIADERMVAFINSFDKGNTPFLENLEKEALAARVPVIRRETQGLIRFLLAAHRPMKILEVGTAIGFSALLM